MNYYLKMFFVLFSPLLYQMMNRKRSLMPDVYKTRKRICTGPGVEAATHSANWYAASPAGE